MDAASRRFTHRELTLILYKAAELQEQTWWLRSVRLALRRPRPRPRPRATYDLAEAKAVAAEMGIDPRFVDEATRLVGGGRPWDAT